MPGGFSIGRAVGAVRRAGWRTSGISRIAGCGRCACGRSIRCTRRRRSSTAARRSRTASSILLLFRQRRSDISDAVYRTLEEQAAQGLTRVPVDAAVDQSQLIRLGYVLIAIVAVAALYKVFSPKDPLVAAERVLMPWADIVPASRVSITDIKPGVVTISRGEFVDVSAEVRGLGDDDAVVLRYTTDDGQVVGRAIPMKAGADRLAVRLPAGR